MNWSSSPESGHRRHVCIVTTAHPRDDVRVGSRITAAFLEAGYRVTWVGPDYSYFRSQADEGGLVEFRLFPARRSRYGRLTAAREAFAVASDVDGVDWWYAPDPDAAVAVLRLAKRLGGKSIFDVHESYHRGLLDRWFPGSPPGLVRELVRRRIAHVCEKVDLVLGVSETVLAPYVTRSANTLIVRNCAPTWFRGADEKSDLPKHGVSFMHGKVSSSNGTSMVLEAARRLPKGAAKEVNIVMLQPVGVAPTAFTRETEARVAAMPEQPVMLRPSVGHREMAGLMAACSVGIIAYQRDLGLESLPNRLFEYMASGLAVIAPSYSPEIVSLLEKERIGIHVDFEDPEAIAGALQWVLEHPAEVSAMGERAREAFLARHNWDMEARKLVERMRTVNS